MSKLSDMKIEPCEHGYMFTATVNGEIQTICTKDGECFQDKHEIREILISVIKNFNKNNTHWKIEKVE